MSAHAKAIAPENKKTTHYIEEGNLADPRSACNLQLRVEYLVQFGTVPSLHPSSFPKESRKYFAIASKHHHQEHILYIGKI